MILQVHDELVFDVPKDEEEIFIEIVREVMEGVLVTRDSIFESELRFPPIRVDIHTGMDWTSAKG